MNASEVIAAMYAAHSVAPDEEPPRPVSLRAARGRDDADTWPCPARCDCLVCEPAEPARGWCGHWLCGQGCVLDVRDASAPRVGNVLETERTINGLATDDNGPGRPE